MNRAVDSLVDIVQRVPCARRDEPVYIIVPLIVCRCSLRPQG